MNFQKEVKLSTVAKRYAAAFIDYAIFIVLIFPVGAIFGEKYITDEGGIGFHLTGFCIPIIMLLWFLIMPLAEGFTGQTIGKYLLKIKVVSVATLQKSLGRSIVRRLFDFVDYFPFFGIVGSLVASNNENKKRVGDFVANTIVIEAS